MAIRNLNNPTPIKPLLLLAAVALLACNICRVQPEKSDFFSVGQDGWAYAQDLQFDPRMEDIGADSISTADIALAVRHTNGYEYSNLWVEVSYFSPDTLVTDTCNLQLADEFGRWLGSGLGVGYQMVDTVLHKVKIDLRHPIGVRHIMRADTLPGIEQVGIIVKF